MAAAATLTVFYLLGEEVEPDADGRAAIDRALLFIGAGIRALRGRGPWGRESHR